MQTVHEFKNAYLKDKEVTNKEVTVLKSRKHGRPRLLKDIKAKAIQTIKDLLTFERCSCKQFWY